MRDNGQATLLMLSSFLCGKNLRCFCVRQRDPDDDDRPSIIVMWRLIGKVVVDYFFCGYAPFIGAWQPALFRFAACLPACLLPAGRWAAHALSVSCCRCWPLWMSKQGDVIDQLDRVVKLFTHPKTPFVFLFFPIILPCGQILLVKQRQNRLFPPIKGGSQGGEMSPNVALEFSTQFLSYKNWPLW